VVVSAAATFAALATGLAILAQEAAPPAVGRGEGSESALYTLPYKLDGHGAVRLPPACEWKVHPRYVGVGEDGQRIVDERVTLVLQDPEHRFWAVVSKLSRSDAERLHRELGEVLAAKGEGAPAAQKK
jgi:hypothetical protein